MSSADVLSSHLLNQNLIDLGVGSLPCRFNENELLNATSSLILKETWKYGSHEGNETLKSLIAQEYKIPSDWVIITNGGSEAITLFYMSLERKKHILLSSLHFPAYRELANYLNAAGATR